MPEPHQLWRRAPWGFSGYRSFDQRLVGQPLARNAINEAAEPVESMPSYVAIIQAKGELVNVAVQMLFAGVVIDADQAAPHHREDAFDAVRGHAIPHVFARAVANRFMFEAGFVDARIDRSLIRVQCRAPFDILANLRLDRLFVRLLDRHGDRLAATFPHRQHRGLAHRAAPGLQLLVLMLVGLFATDIHLVDLDNAFQRVKIVTARFAQTMQHEPRGLLGDANFLGKLHRRYALAGRDQQVHAVNPLVQGNVAALENRAGAHCKVFLALVAAIIAVLAYADAVAKAANRALDAIRPQAAFKIDPRHFLVGEHLEKLKGRNRAFGHCPNPLLNEVNLTC